MAGRSRSGPTRSDVVLARIRADVLNGRLAPGSRLGFADLGLRYEVSTGVLREVLPRLVEQGLATSEAQLGFRVVDVSVDRLSQLTDARVAIDTLVTRQAVIDGDIAWEGDVIAKHHALTRVGEAAEDDDISEEWLRAHEAFHRAILEGCHNGYLVETAERLRSISVVYRCWTRPASERAHRDLAHEHREIMEATVARDGDTAVRLTEAHIRHTTELLISGREAAEAAEAASASVPAAAS
ncbi:DNA-binding GntR family transcriptional regulator [Streptomyces aurantiacus]|uniref:GntR family transcriptional regulator n=1 Tax=Streptomyces aurantiacus TaxID=47760 RepID=UPI0027941608|nr:FCD domain-containing protein [Streptomyces aurantiacus]MDQ0775355.1 DNA-binding GntR family transcriptional regulator [Streptomyces aurantiacus]